MRLLLALALVVAGCGRTSPTKPSPAASATAALGGPRLEAHRAERPLLINGELDEPDWLRAVRTGAFVSPERGAARPFSEARFTWDAQNLYLGLYAADDDIEVGTAGHDGPLWIKDAFSVRIMPGDGTRYTIDFSPGSDVTDVKIPPGGSADASWESGARVGIDRDGTPNDPADMDEEWVVEAAVPFERLGIHPSVGTRIRLGVTRCDTPHGGKRSCGAWGDGDLVLAD